MKKILAAGLLLVSSALYAQTLTVKTPLKNEAILKVVISSVEEFLSYESDLVAGGLSGDLEKVTIVEIVKEEGRVSEITVESNAFYYSYDFDFGDPVDEEFTKCRTTLLKNRFGLYSVEKSRTTCDFDPRVDSHF